MKCPDLFFSMDLDFYYATTIQDKYGVEAKTWVKNQTLVGYVESVGSEDKSKTFFEYKGKLIGRTKKDPRVSSSGTYFPMTSILITDIKDTCSETKFFIESAGNRVGKSTIYEISAIEPYINPFNIIEYYRIFLNRTDAQALGQQ